MNKESGNILENIIQLRKARGFSQEYVASKIGMKQAGYALIESGERGLQYNALLQIAIALEMDVIDVITYPDVYTKNSLSTKEKMPRVTLQIDVDDDVKADVIKLVFGSRVLEIKNK